MRTTSAIGMHPELCTQQAITINDIVQRGVRENCSVTSAHTSFRILARSLVSNVLSYRAFHYAATPQNQSFRSMTTRDSPPVLAGQMSGAAAEL